MLFRPIYPSVLCLFLRKSRVLRIVFDVGLLHFCSTALLDMRFEAVSGKGDFYKSKEPFIKVLCDALPMLPRLIMKSAKPAPLFRFICCGRE